MSIDVILAGLMQGGIYALASIGLTVMFGILRIINFAHGDFLMVAMYACYLLFASAQIDPVLGAFLVAPLLMLGGAVLYRILLRRTFAASSPELAQVFATVGLSIFLQNLALLTMGADYFETRSTLLPSVTVLGPLRLETMKLVMVTAALVLAFAFSRILYRTEIGKQMRAVAQNASAARLMGINVDRVYTWTFAMACGAVGLAGALMSASFLVYPTVGLHFALLSFMTVVIGGLGSIPGAIIGGFTIGLVQAITGYVLGPILAEVFVYLIFLGVLLIRPSGLFGVRGFLEAKAE